MSAEYSRLQIGDDDTRNFGNGYFASVSDGFWKRISRSYSSSASKGSRKPCAVWSIVTIVGIITLLIGATVYNDIGYTDFDITVERNTGNGLQSTLDKRNDRPLILYAYHETPNARQNAIFFINHGLHSGADFIFILNGHTNLTLLIPTAPNIKIVQRPNKCFDLGSYGEVLTAHNDKLIKKYDKFIMLNGSIRGPFMPTWSRECWSDAYLAKVTDTNKLVGMTFNCDPVYGVRHLQSMIFATDRIGIMTLLPIMNTCFPTWLSAVYGESNSTHAIMDAGYTVSAMMTSFASEEHYAETCKHGDILLEKAYFGGNVHPYETIFQKANRGFGQNVLDKLTEWTDLAGYSSWEVCGRKREELKPLGGWGRWKEAAEMGFS
ncbi:hypothetical protein TWF481_004506 [Arthrobotrys musiformis]|uniref:Uncharacterized protein n=1 Tax=Arthrobotrys musiformis TaxID=47236 RepID=A0AAV9WKQ0_9PEZI